MSSAVVDKILEEVKSLMPEERQSLLDALEPEQRAEIVRSVRGKYAHLGVSTEDVIRMKAEEIELEERRSRQ